MLFGYSILLVTGGFLHNKHPYALHVSQSSGQSYLIEFYFKKKKNSIEE